MDNVHHILWPRKKWRKGYSKKLRNHWYMKCKTNMWVHENLHANFYLVEIPKDNLCKQIYYELIELDKKGVLHKDDFLETRIDILLIIMRNYEEDENFVKCLERQKEIVRALYLIRPG